VLISPGATSTRPVWCRWTNQANCDELIQRLTALRAADPPLDLLSHELTHRLVKEASPINHVAYKHREDLIDAAIAAWTASLWFRYGISRCQVLGATEDVERPAATIIAPARPEQRAQRPKLY
jgi:predicted RNase H-like nuclease